MSQWVTGRKTTAAMTPETIRPWYSARSTFTPRTAYVPMIDAMIATPPMISGYRATFVASRRENVR